MASFGAVGDRLSLRETVSENALVNWYKILWHGVVEGHAASLPRNVVETGDHLEDLLHYHPRSDTKITVGMMKVWALCRVSELGTHPVCAYDDVVRKDARDVNFKKEVALLAASPVMDIYVPPMYRVLPPFGSAVNTCMLSDAGILQLFSIWHLSLLDEKSGSFAHTLYPSPSEKAAQKHDVPAGDVAGAFSAQELKRLEAIYCCTHLPATDIYACKSDENIYTRIKLSSLASVEQHALAGHLFDFNPADYKQEVVGYLLSLGKTHGLAFCYGDEILWTSGRVLWLMDDLSRQMVACVCDGAVTFCARNDKEGMEQLTLFLAGSVDGSQRIEILE